MIVGSSYSPAKAFVGFAREFFVSVADGDYGAALSRLDMTNRKWTKAELQGRFAEVLGGQEIGSASGFVQSASPLLEEIDSDRYVLHHRVPLARGWSNAIVTFQFTRKPETDYFHVELVRVAL